MHEIFELPFFLHCRNAASDLNEILIKYSGLKGVVHSFDGTSEEAKQFVDLGFHIGLNGWYVFLFFFFNAIIDVIVRL